MGIDFNPQPEAKGAFRLAHLWDVIGGKLYPDPWLAVDQHHVPIVLGINGAAEDPGPEAAFGRQICSIEYDYLMVDLHPGTPSLVTNKSRFPRGTP